MGRYAFAALAVAITACSGSRPSSTPTQPTTPVPTGATVTALSVKGVGCADSVCPGHVGDTLQLTALAQLSDNTSADVTVKAQWSTSNATVATVNDTGLVTFRAPGDADILATYQGKQAGDTVRLTSCSYTPDAFTFNASGGSDSVSVRTASGCAWKIAADQSWITVGNRGPLTEPETIPFTVGPNRSFNGRSGSIVVTTETGTVLASHTVSQRAAGCLYSVDPSSLSLSFMGTYDGAGDSPMWVQVHTEPAGCSWTAKSSVPWIQIVYGSDHGNGDATIYVSLLVWNTGPTRTGDVVVAGLSGVNPDAHLQVTQKGQ